jgi:hypothetical protein
MTSRMSWLHASVTLLLIESGRVHARGLQMCGANARLTIHPFWLYFSLHEHVDQKSHSANSFVSEPDLQIQHAHHLEPQGI